jgi:diguanylate cyclase (GGDEF)-like protein
MNAHAVPIETLRPVVAALADLTAQRDELSLVQRLFTLLGDIWPGVTCWLARTPPDSYPSADNLIVLGDAPTLPLSLAIIGLQLKSRDAINQYLYEGRHYVLAHIAQPDSNDEDLLVVETERALDEAETGLFRDLMQVYKNHLESLAVDDRDVLTGLRQRGTFLKRLTEQLDARLSGRRYREEGNADYLAVISPDAFRAVNTGHGHLTGDLLLLALARALAETLREGDLLFRLGGKEFAVIIYDLAPDEATEVCERLRARIEAEPLANDIPLTVSIGYAPLRDHALPHDLLDDARRALADAKAGGRNQIRLADAAGTLDDDAEGAQGKAIELF